MAVMIPDYYVDTGSEGERQLFHELRDAPGTEDWHVLHSLHIARHVAQVEGEADFVILVPGRGVLFLEVKACHALLRRGAEWYYGTNPKSDRRGPFVQARDGMRSVRDDLLSRTSGFRDIVFCSAVCFTHLTFAEQSAEWHAWQVIDDREFRKEPIADLILRVLDRARDHVASAGTARWFDRASVRPTVDEVRQMSAALRPDFELHQNPADRLRGLAENVKRYTQEQFDALDEMRRSPRVIFEGKAGTGKTLLALEAAQRAVAGAGPSEKRKVLLLCYNKLLGRRLEEETAPLRPHVEAGTLHAHMLRVCGWPPVPKDATSDWWDKELPERAARALRDRRDDRFKYDELIVDEAQDLSSKAYLHFLDRSLRGGLKGARWRFFCDPEQNIFVGGPRGADHRSVDQLIDQYGAAHRELGTNCRNTRRIAGWVERLAGLVPGYRRVRREDGTFPTIHYYSDGEEQARLLEQSLCQLARDGFSARDVAVLSFADGASCAMAAASNAAAGSHCAALAAIEEAPEERIPFCTARRFKGLEAGAVVVSDVEQVASLESRRLFYVSMTRALHRLVLLVHQDAKADLQEALSRSL